MPLTVIIAFLLLGIEEIGGECLQGVKGCSVKRCSPPPPGACHSSTADAAVAIEEPFSILPLEQLCDVIERNVWELLETHSQPSVGGGGAGEQQSASSVVAAAMEPVCFPPSRGS